MIKNKGFILVLIVSALVVGLGGALAYNAISAAHTEFEKDGYILSSTNNGDIEDNVNQNYYFNGGEEYKVKYPSKVVFKDNSGKKVAVDQESYVHYAEGSIGALTSGVIVDLNNLNKKDLCYYGITPLSTLEKMGEAYEVNNMGEEKVFSDFIWKTSETSYLVGSKSVKLYDGKSKGKEFPAYAEINYVDNGVVYIVSQEGTYQTISTDAHLKFENGVKLYLTSKDVVKGKETPINLSEMLVGSDDNVEIKPTEAKEDVKEKEPEYIFDVTNGQEGDKGNKGTGGEEGTGGEAGTPGDPGQAGTGGTGGAAGGAGAAGSQGTNGKPGIPGIDAGTGEDSGEKPPKLDEEDMLIFPEFVLDLEEIGASTVQGTLNIVAKPNETATLVEGGLTLRIVDAVTGQQAYEKALKTEYGTNESFQTEALRAGTQYIIKVSGAYTFKDEQSEREFVSKLFSTKELGISFVKKYATTTSLCLSAVVDADCQADQFAVLLYDADGKEVKKIERTVKELKDDPKKSIIEFTGLKKNSKYYIKVQAAIPSSSGAISTVTITPDPESYLTLKEDPTFGDLKSRLSKKDGAFILQPGSVTDPDGGIISYKYEVYEAANIGGAEGVEVTGKPVFTMEKSSLTDISVPIYGKIIKRDTAYTYRVVVLFDNNEAKIDKVSIFSDAFTMTGKGYPGAYFTGGTNTATSYNSTLTIEDPDQSMAFWNEGTIKVACVPNNPFQGEIIPIYQEFSLKELPSESQPINTTVKLPIKMNGLRSGEPYTIEVTCSSLTLGDGETVDNPMLTMSTIRTMSHETVKIDSEMKPTDKPFEIQLIFSTPQDNQRNGYESIRGLQGMKFELKPVDGTYPKGTLPWVNSSWDPEDAYQKPNAFYSFDSSDLNRGTLTLTPESFSIPNEQFQSVVGKKFRIFFSEGHDYTRFASAIPLEKKGSQAETGSNYVEFTIGEITPKLPVTPGKNTTCTSIINQDAEEKYKEPTLLMSTVVGIKAQDKLGSNMCKAVQYYVYKKGAVLQQNGGGSIGSSGWIEVPTGAIANAMAPAHSFYFKDNKELKRGETYLVMTEYQLKKNGADGSPLIFPYSNMENKTGVFLMSSDVDAPKQTPKLYVYPWESKETSSTWRYTIWDADKALTYKQGESQISENVAFESTEPFNSVSIESQEPVASQDGISHITFKGMTTGSGIGYNAQYKTLSRNSNYASINFASGYRFKTDVDWTKVVVTYTIDKNVGELVVRSTGDEETLKRLSKMEIAVTAQGIASKIFSFGTPLVKKNEYQGTSYVECKIPLSNLVAFAGKEEMNIKVTGRYLTGETGAKHTTDNNFFSVSYQNQGSYYFKSDTEGMYHDANTLVELSKGTVDFSTKLLSPPANYTKEQKGEMGIKASNLEKTLGLTFNENGMSFAIGGGPMIIAAVDDCTIGKMVEITDLAFVLPEASVNIVQGINMATVNLAISDKLFSDIQGDKLYLVFEETDGEKFEKGEVPDNVEILYDKETKSATVELIGLKPNTSYEFKIKAKMGKIESLETIAKPEGADKETPYAFNTINHLTIKSETITLLKPNYSEKKLTISGIVDGIKFTEDYHKIKVEFYVSGDSPKLVAEATVDSVGRFEVTIDSQPGGDISLSANSTYPITMKIMTTVGTPLELCSQVIQTPKLITPIGIPALTVGYEETGPSIEAKVQLIDGDRIIPEDTDGKVSIAFDLYEGRTPSAAPTKRQIVSIQLMQGGGFSTGKTIFTGLKADAEYTVSVKCVADLNHENITGITEDMTLKTGKMDLATSTKRTLEANRITIGEIKISRINENDLKLVFENSYKLKDVSSIVYSVYRPNGTIMNGTRAANIEPIVSGDGQYTSTFQTTISGVLATEKGDHVIALVFKNQKGEQVENPYSLVLSETTGLAAFYSTMMDKIKTIIN